jgi:hypothetical protein
VNDGFSCRVGRFHFVRLYRLLGSEQGLTWIEINAGRLAYSFGATAVGRFRRKRNQLFHVLRMLSRGVRYR